MEFIRELYDYLNGVEILNSRIENLPDEILNYRPNRKNAWTIKEHIIHPVDSETNGFIRCKSIIAQPFSECNVMEYN